MRRAKAIELGDHDRAPHRPRFGERRRQLRPAVERVASLASFDLDEFGHDIEAHFLREPGQRFPLRFDAETGAALARCADPDVSDKRFHERLKSLYKPFSGANWIKSPAWFARRGWQESTHSSHSVAGCRTLRSAIGSRRENGRRTPSRHPGMSVADWLKGLDLGQYAQAFADNDIDLALAATLTDAYLKEIGVASLGHRRKLLAAAAALTAKPPATQPTPPPTFYIPRAWA